MSVLGLSFGFHDSAAALIVDGKIAAACQQERISRVKNDAGFPGDAVEFCLSRAGLRARDLEIVAFHEEPLLKFDRIVRSWMEGSPGADGEFDAAVARWIREGRFDVRGFIARRLDIEPGRVRTCRHHESHASSAFFMSPFETATTVTLDGVGEYETASVGLGEGLRIRQLGSMRLPHSLGLFYSAFTAFLGFPVNEGEYKVMGMAAFGRPIHQAGLRALFELRSGGGFELDQTLFAFGGMSRLPYSAAMIERFGPPREPGAPFGIDEASLPSTVSPTEAADVIAASRRYADIAASVQACAEDVIRGVVRGAVERTAAPRVAMAGGVALNSLANGRLLRDDGIELFIQPAAGDAGCALGAALHQWHHTLGRPRLAPQTSCAFGREFDRAACRRAAQASGYAILHDGDDLDSYIRRVADLLADGHVVGWLHGRSEWGPRALGHRSILADPRRPEMQRLVNEKVKFREPFRPFAPAVLAEAVDDYFERRSARPPGPSDPEAFMLAVHPVKAGQCKVLPAITHVDGTARVQVVHSEEHPVFYRLIQAFGQRTGIPVLLNTSFNLNGEPIVDSPGDAIRTFSLSGLDHLALGGVILSKDLVAAL